MRSMKLLLPALLLAVACSKSGGGTTADPGGDPYNGTGPATVTDYCDQYWSVYATRWAACEHASASEAAAVHAPGPRCVDTVQAVLAGRATYAASRGGACLSFIETASCDVVEAYMAGTYPQADCEAAVAGNVAENGTCYSNESCASGICLWSPDACPSACATPVPAGSTCDVVRPCAAGTYCSMVTNKCTAVVGLDGACNYLDPCAPGLYCEQISFGNSVCHARRTSGSCYGDGPCAIGFRCSNSTCVPWLAAGEPCTQGANGCGPGLWCGAGGTCIDGANPTWSCASVNGEQHPCIGGHCTPLVTGNVCTAWLASGGTCSLQSQCAPTDVCDTAGTGKCTTLCSEP